MWTRKSSKTNGGKDEAQTSSSRRKEGSSRPRSDSKTTSATPKKSSSSRGDDRDRGVDPSTTGYTSAPQDFYSGTGAPSVASSYATAAMNPAEYQHRSSDLIRSNTFPDQTSNTRYRRDEDGYGEQNTKKERRSDRGESRDDGKKSSGGGDRDEDKRERRERRERKKDSEREKDRGISRSDTYPPSSSRGPADFGAQVHGSGFTQFPGQYDGGFTGSRGARPQQNEPLSSHVPDQFPGQFPSESARPYRPPLAKNEGGPGLASEYYGDTGQSVHEQPGVRPQPPPLIIGAEPHLQPASAVEAPPPEPSLLGQTGAAASFYNGTEDFGPSSAPSRPLQKLNTNQAPSGNFPAAAPLAGAVAAGMMASNASFSQSNSHYSEQTSYQSRPSTSAPSTAPSNTTYYSSSTNQNPIINAAGAAAAGTAAGYVLGHHSSSSGQAPQGPMMSGALNSSQQSSYQSVPPSSRPPTNTQHTSSTANPVLGAVGAAAAGAAAGYLLGNHSSSSNQAAAHASTNGSFQGRPSDQRPPIQPLSYHQDSQNFTGNVHASYAHESSQANGTPHHSSNAPLYAAGLAGAAGLAAASMHNGHHDGRHSPSHGSFSYPHGSMAQQHHQKYHQRQGPLDRFVDFWRDPYAVGQYEEYTEYIGVCRYCFSPGSSARDAPRRHHHGRHKSSYERLNAASRVGKDYRRYSSSSDSDRERKNKNKSWLAAGLGAYGLGTVGKKLFAANLGFDDTYSVQSGKPVGGSSKERRSYSEAEYTRMPGSYPDHERMNGAQALYTKTSSADVMWSGKADKTHRSRSRSRERKSRLEFFAPGPAEMLRKQTRRSRSRSRERKSILVETATGAAVAGTILASTARHGRSPERRNGNHPHAPPVGYVEVRRDGRREHGHSTSPHHRSNLVEVRHKEDRNRHRHSISPRRQKKTKQNKGFFSFSNSSSSSADSTLAFGGEFEKQRSKKDLRLQKKSSDKTDAAILGLGAAAAAIALQQSHSNGKGKQRADAPSLTKPHQIYAADGRKDSHGRYGHYHGPDAEGWESASDDDHSSVDSMLAYGMSRRSSRESLRSDSSGTEKWSWRWGGEKKKKSSKKLQHHDTSAPVLGAAATAAVGRAIIAERVHRHDERNHQVGSSGSLPPMQQVFPYSTGDPTTFDATRHNSTISPSQPLTTVRPSPLPLQQPQPLSQIATSVLVSMAPLDHSYSAPVGPVYGQPYPSQATTSKVAPSAILPRGQDAMPGSFPLRPDISHNIQPVIKEISPRRRASTPPDPSKASQELLRNSMGIDVSPSVRFNLSQEDEDRERREKRRRKKEEKARRAEAERLEELQQAEIDEAERLSKVKSQKVASPPRRVLDKHEGPLRHESDDRERRSERRGRSDSQSAVVDRNTSWVTPALAGAAGAAVGAAIIHEIEPRRKDRAFANRDDNYEKVDRPLDYHHDDKYQEVYQRVMHDHEDSKDLSREKLSEEERRYEKKRAKVAREAARRISRTPSPVYNHDKYSDFFQLPPGASEAAREAEEEKKFYGVPDADNEIYRYRVLPREKLREAEEKKPKAVYNVHGELMDTSRMMPWKVAPMLNLVEPTPPGSVAGSVRGDASPVISPETHHSEIESEIVSITEVDEPAKEVPKQRSASKVRFGDNAMQEYEVITPEGHREEFIESTYRPLKRAYAEDSIKSAARSSSPEEIVPRERSRHDHMPSEFGDDIDFTATVAAGLEDSGFPSSIVVDDPSFRRRDSPPGSDGKRPGSDKRDLSSVYQKPFYETVTNPGQDLTCAKDDVQHNEAKAPNVMDFLVEEPAEHMVEIKPRGDAKTKDTGKKRSLKDVIGLVGAAGASGALANAASSSPPRKSGEGPTDASKLVRQVPEIAKRDSTTSPKPREFKGEDSDQKPQALAFPFPERPTITDDFYDAPDLPRSRQEDVPKISRPVPTESSDTQRPKPEAIPLPIGDDDELESREVYQDARFDASEAMQMRNLGEPDITDALQTKETIVDNVYEESRKLRKKSKRKSNTDFDDLASVASAPIVIERSPEIEVKSKGKSKKDRKGGLFGIFSKSSEDVSERSKDKGISKTPDYYDDEEPAPRSRKSKERKSTVDDYDDDVQSRASEPVPATEFEEVSQKGKKSKGRRSTRDDFYDDDIHSRASEPAPLPEYEESGKRSKKSKDRKTSRGDYDDDTLSRASEPVPMIPGLGDAEDDAKSRKKRDKDERRKSRKESKVDREPGRVTQDLPAKVHLPASPADSSLNAVKGLLLTEVGEMQNGDSDETVLIDRESRRRERSLPQVLDQDQSFLGERRERKKPPDEDFGYAGGRDRDSHQRSKDVEAALQVLSQTRPSTPESDASQREVQSTPSHRRHVSMLQSSDFTNVVSTPSPTAIPISFRMGARPSSLQLTRSSPDTPTLATSQPDTPKSRKQRPKSGEIRRSTEFRPLFLVEKHSARQEPTLEERYPSLPSSHTTSRASSVHGGGDEEDEVARLVDREHRKGSYHEHDMGIDVGHYNEADLLDSQQATPTATSFKEAGDSTAEQSDIVHQRDRRFSQGEVETDVPVETILKRRSSRAEKERRRSDSFLKNVAWDQLAGGTAALEALRYINTPFTRLHEGEYSVAEGTKELHEDRPLVESNHSQDQYSQEPAVSTKSFDALEKDRSIYGEVERGDVSQVTPAFEPHHIPIPNQQIELVDPSPAAGVERPVEAEPIEVSFTPTSSKTAEKNRKSENATNLVESEFAQITDNRDLETKTISAHRGLTHDATPDVYSQMIKPSEPLAHHEETHSIERTGHAPTLSKDMSTTAIVATMAAAAGAITLDQHHSDKSLVGQAPLEEEFESFEPSKSKKGKKKSRRANVEHWETVEVPREAPTSHLDTSNVDTDSLNRDPELADAHDEILDTVSYQDATRDEPVENFTPLKKNKKSKKRSSIATPEPEAVLQEADLVTDPPMQDPELAFVPTKKGKKGKKGNKEQVTFDDFEETIPSVLEQPREVLPLEKSLSPRFLALPEGDDFDLEELPESTLSSEYHALEQGDSLPAHEDIGNARETLPIPAEPDALIPFVTEQQHAQHVQEHEVLREAETKNYEKRLDEATRELPALDQDGYVGAKSVKLGESPSEIPLTEPVSEVPIEEADASVPRDLTSNQDDDYFGFASTKKGRKGKKGRKSQPLTPLQDSTTATEVQTTPAVVPEIEDSREGEHTPTSLGVPVRDAGADEWAPSTGKKKGKKFRKSQAASFEESEAMGQTSTNPSDLPGSETTGVEEPMTPAIPERSEFSHEVPVTEEMQPEEPISEEWAATPSKKKGKKANRQSIPFEDSNVVDETSLPRILPEPETRRDLDVVPPFQKDPALQPDGEDWAPSPMKKGKKGKKPQFLTPFDDPLVSTEDIATPVEKLVTDADQSLDSSLPEESVRAPEPDERAPSTAEKKGKKNRKSTVFDEPSIENEDTTIPMEMPQPETSRDLNFTSLPEKIQALEAETLDREAEATDWTPSSKKKGKKSKKGKAAVLDLKEPVDESAQERIDASRDIQANLPGNSASDKDHATQQGEFGLETQNVALQPSAIDASRENTTSLDEGALASASIYPMTSDILPSEVPSTSQMVEPPTPTDDPVSIVKAKGKRGKKGKRSSSNANSPVVDRRQSTDDWMDAGLDEPTRFDEPKSIFEGAENVDFEEPESLPAVVTDGAREIQEAQAAGHDRPFTPIEGDLHTSLRQDEFSEPLFDVISDGARAVKDEPTFDFRRPVTPDASESSVIFVTPPRYPDEPLSERSQRFAYRSISSTSQSTHNTFHEAEEEQKQETPRLRPTYPFALHDIDVRSQSTPSATTFDPSDIALPLDEPSDFEADDWHDLGRNAETDMDRELAGEEGLRRIVTLDENDDEVGDSDQNERGLPHDFDCLSTPRVVEEPADQLAAHVLHKADELFTSTGAEQDAGRSGPLEQGVKQHDDRLATPKAKEEQLPAHVLHRADELLMPSGNVDEVSEGGLAKRQSFDRPVTPQPVNEPVDQLPANVLDKVDKPLQDSPQAQTRGVLTPPIDREVLEETLAPEDVPKVGSESTHDVGPQNQRHQEQVENLVHEHKPSTSLAEEITLTEAEQPTVPAEVPGTFSLKKSKKDKKKATRAQTFESAEGEEALTVSGIARDTPIEGTRAMEASTNPLIENEEALSEQPMVENPGIREKSPLFEDVDPVTAELPTSGFKKSKKDKRKSKKYGWDEEAAANVEAEAPAKDLQTETALVPQLLSNQPIEQNTSVAQEDELSTQPISFTSIEASQDGMPPKPQESKALEEVVPEDLSSYSLKKSKKDKKKPKRTKALDWNEPDVSSSSQATPGTQSLETSTILPEPLREKSPGNVEFARPAADTIQEQDRGLQDVISTTEPSPSPEDENAVDEKKSKKDERKSKEAKKLDFDDKMETAPGTAASIPAPAIETREVAETLPMDQPKLDERTFSPDEAPIASEGPPAIPEESPYSLKKSKKDKKKSKRAQTLEFDNEPDLASSGILTPNVPEEAEVTATSDDHTMSKSIVPDEEPVVQEHEYFSSFKKGKRDKRKAKRAQAADLDDEPGLTSSGMLTPNVPKELDSNVTSKGPDSNQTVLPKETAIVQDDGEFASFRKSKKDKKKAKSKAPDWIDEPQAESSTNPTLGKESEPSFVPSSAQVSQPILTDEPIGLERSLSTDVPSESLVAPVHEQSVETSPAPDEFSSLSTKKGKKDGKKGRRVQALDWTEDPEATLTTFALSGDGETLASSLPHEQEVQIPESAFPNAVEPDEALSLASKKKSEQAELFAWDVESAKPIPEDVAVPEIKDHQSQLPKAQGLETREEAEDFPKDIVSSETSETRRVEELERHREENDVLSQMQYRVSEPEVSASRDVQEHEHDSAKESEPLGATELLGLQNFDTENLQLSSLSKEPPPVEHEPILEPAAIHIIDAPAVKQVSVSHNDADITPLPPPPVPELLSRQHEAMELPLFETQSNVEPSETQVTDEASSMKHVSPFILGNTESLSHSQIQDVPLDQPVTLYGHGEEVMHEPSVDSSERAPRSETTLVCEDRDVTALEPLPEVSTPIDDSNDFSVKKGKKGKKKSKRAQSLAWEESEVPGAEDPIVKDTFIGRSTSQDFPGDYAKLSEPVAGEIVANQASRPLSSGILDEDNPSKVQETIPLLEEPQQPPTSLDESQELPTSAEEPLEYGVTKGKRDKKKSKKAQAVAWDEATDTTRGINESTTHEMQTIDRPIEPIPEPIIIEPTTEPHQPASLLPEPNEFSTKKSKRDKKKAQKAQAFDLNDTPQSEAPLALGSPSRSFLAVDETSSSDQPIEPKVTLGEEKSFDEPQEAAQLSEGVNEPSGYSLKKSKKGKKKGKNAQAVPWDEPSETPLDIESSIHETQPLDEPPVLPKQEVQQPNMALEQHLDASQHDDAEADYFPSKQSKKDRKAKKAQTLEWNEESVTETPKVTSLDGEQSREIPDETIQPDEVLATERSSAPEQRLDTEVVSGKKSKKDKKGKKSKTLDWDEEPGAAAITETITLLPTTDEAPSVEIERTSNEAPIAEDVDKVISKRGKKDKRSKQAQEQAWDEQPRSLEAAKTQFEDRLGIIAGKDLQSETAEFAQLAAPEPEASDYFSVKKSKKDRKKSKQAAWDEPVQEVEPLKELYYDPAQDGLPLSLAGDTQIVAPLQDEPELGFSSSKKSRRDKKGKGARDETWEESAKEVEPERGEGDVIMPEANRSMEGEVVDTSLPTFRDLGVGKEKDDVVMPQEMVDAGASMASPDSRDNKLVEDVVVPQEMERESIDEQAAVTTPEELDYLPIKKGKKDKRKKKAMEGVWEDSVQETRAKGVDEMTEVSRELEPKSVEIAESPAAIPIEDAEYFSTKKSKKDKRKSKTKAVSWDEPVEEEVMVKIPEYEASEKVRVEGIDPTTQVLNELGLEKVDLPEKYAGKVKDEVTQNVRTEKVDPTADVLRELGLEKVELPEEYTAMATNETTKDVKTHQVDPAADVLQEVNSQKVDVPEQSAIDVVDYAETGLSHKGKAGKSDEERGLPWDESRIQEQIEKADMASDVQEPDLRGKTPDDAVAGDDFEFSTKKSKKDMKRSRKSQVGQREEPLPELEPTIQREMTTIPEIVVEEPEASNTVIVNDESVDLKAKRNSKRDKKEAQFFDDLGKSMQMDELMPESEERGLRKTSQEEEQVLPSEPLHILEPMERSSTPPTTRDEIISPPPSSHRDLDEPTRPREVIAEDDFAGFTSTKKRKKPKRMETFDAEANEAREALEEQHVERPTSQHAREAPVQDFNSGQLVRADESQPPLTEIAALLPPIRKRSKRSKKSAGSQHSGETPFTQGEMERGTLERGGGLSSMLPRGDFYPSPEPPMAMNTALDKRAEQEGPYAYPEKEPVEPHTFPVEQPDRGRPEELQVHSGIASRDMEDQRPMTPPAEFELSRKKSKKGKRNQKDSENLFGKPNYANDGEAIGGAVEMLPEETLYTKVAPTGNDSDQPLDLASKKSKRSRKSRNRSPEPVEEESSFDPKPGVAAGIAAGVALFEGLQRGKSTKKTKDRKSSTTVDWDDLDPEEHLAGKVKNRRESIEKGARPEEFTRGDVGVPHMQTREMRMPSQGQHLDQDNRDSGVHFDSPIMQEQSPITRNSVRDSGYQGIEDSPRVSSAPPDQARDLHVDVPRDVEDGRTHHLQADERESTNVSHRTSMAESSDNPLNISIEVDPGYDISVSRPVGEREDRMHRRQREHRSISRERHHDLSQQPDPETLHGHPPGDALHERSIEHPTQVHSTSRDRSSGLFDSSPSTRDHASAYDSHHPQPTDDTLQATSRDMPVDQSRLPFYTMQERANVQPTDDSGHSAQGSLFGGPIGINSDQVLSPPRTPVESASSRRRRLNTITEHSPEDLHQHKHPREASDLGLSEPNSKSARRSSTPKTFAQHRVRSPLGASQLAGVAAATGIAGALSTDKIIAGMSWPSIDEDNQSIDLDKITKPSRETSRNSSGQHDDPAVLAVKNKGGRRSLSGASVASSGDRDSIRAYIQSNPDNTRSISGTPPLRRSDRSISGDLRAANKRESAKKQAKPYEETDEREFVPDVAIASSSTYDPVKDKGKSRSRDMADVYEGWGDFHGSPRSPTRPPSMRRRQSMQILDLETKLDQLLAENRSLQEGKSKAERNLENVAQDHTQENVALRKALQAKDEYLAQKDAELGAVRASLDHLHDQVSELQDMNRGLEEAGNEFAAEHRTKYSQLEAEHNNTIQQWNDASHELDLYKDKHHTLSTGMESIVRQEISVALAKKNTELKTLQIELQTARQQIVALQQQILTARRASPDPDIPQRDEDYFDEKCQELCQHVKQWVLRYSKFSDSYVCRHSNEVRDEKISDRFDSAVLDGSDVDVLLADRVRRRDVFVSVVMTMVWEFVFTRYLFGMDREQRSKLKALEKTLGEVGPAGAVNRWRATTLGLLSKRPAFEAQRERDTEAVVVEILDTLAAYLPPPSADLKTQLRESLRKVVRAAVSLSVEMRCQRAEYIMLPPLQPEYDANGDLAHQVYFNAQLMNERSGVERSNEELMERRAVVQMVLFPLVVKRGGAEEGAEEEIVVCPAQVLVAPEAGRERRSVSAAQGREGKRVRLGGVEGNRSTGSFAPSSMDPGLGNVI